jgi:hypothetical protein
MRKILSTILFGLAFGAVASAQSRGDLCHVYVVDVETARKALATGNVNPNTKPPGLTVFPEFRSVIGEEELTTRSYPFPGNKLVITASVFYTDESMASTEGVDSMQVGIAVSEKAQKEALSAENNALAEISMNQRDTVRTKKYLTVGGRQYLVGMECKCREK